MFDSEPPTTAILAAEAVAGRGIEFLQRAQRAHYVEGRRIAEFTVLTELAADIGLEPAAFADAVRRLRGAATATHLADSRAFLAQVGGQGFPTFVLERGTRRQRIDFAAFIGNVEHWRVWLAGIVDAAGRPDGLASGCNPEGCALPGEEKTT